MTTPDIQKNIINMFVIKFLSDHINSSNKQENIDAWKNEENQKRLQKILKKSKKKSKGKQVHLCPAIILQEPIPSEVIDIVEITSEDKFKLFQTILITKLVDTNFKKPKKISGSFIELLPTLNSHNTQSVSIKLGLVFENALNSFIEKLGEIDSSIEYLGNEYKKIEETQIDLLFRLNDNIYYFEIKTNINLDTEKSKSTYNKILDIGEKLQYIFPRNEIKYSLLNLRFPTRFEVPPTLIKEPLKSFDGFYGYADFFNLFDINIIEQQWIDLCKEIDSKLLLLI